MLRAAAPFPLALAQARATLHRQALGPSAGSRGPQAYTGRGMLTTHKGVNISEQELIATIDAIVMAKGKSQLDQAVQNGLVATQYSLKGDVVRR